MPSPLLLVTTGAESSGKTTLAQALAAALSAPLVNESSRSYLNARLELDPCFHYQEEDLYHIAVAQREVETTNVLLTTSYVVCDTDLVVLQIWSEVRYGHVAPRLQALIDESLSERRLFLLCAPDMPWEPDPLRENPSDRWPLFERYRDFLDARALPYLTLAGPHPERVQTVLAHLALDNR